MPTYFYHDDTISLVDENGDKFRLRVEVDNSPESPREWENIGNMVCWHRRYNLGDEHKYDDHMDFLRSLVREYVPEKKVIEFAKKNTDNVMLKYNRSARLWEIWVYCYWDYRIAKSKPDWELEIQTDFTYVYDYIIDNLCVSSCESLLEKYVEILPLYLYDHSGITMSTTSFNDRWDSGQVGYIYASREDFINNTGYLKSELFDCKRDRKPKLKEHVKVKGYGHPGLEYWGQVTAIKGKRVTIDFEYGITPSMKKPESIVTVDLSQITEVMSYQAAAMLEGEVKTYDQYLRGDVYGFHLEKEIPGEDDEEPEYEEIESCWGFYGDTLEESGMMDYIGNYKIA